MVSAPAGVRVWLGVGRTDMRRGMNGLALQVQQALGRDPHAGDLYVFRGARGDLVKIIWHDGIGLSLYPKRLESGRFIWPSPADGAVAISAAQLSYMLDGIDWRKPRHTFRPTRAGYPERTFYEPGARICDSIAAWWRGAKTCRKRLTRCAQHCSLSAPGRRGSRRNWRWPSPRRPTMPPSSRISDYRSRN